VRDLEDGRVVIEKDQDAKVVAMGELSPYGPT
jgi:hypothetical protein